ncbi:MAG: Stp1/IreP family PP2C-type Ser/Thr phosphatase [Nitrospira sp.]|nr:Stp1/IreP family PP2C-type Ser/Thr phosphatase [Nitrospira sp.]
MHSWHVTHGAASDIGRTRHHNEDRFHADPAAGLFIVCDGMGGHRAGEVASSRTIELIPQYLATAAADPALPLIGMTRPEWSVATNRLASAVRLANHRIHQEAAHEQAYAGMGTTVVAACLAGSTLSIAHVGDSRLYLIRDRTIQLLTQDHSLVQEQLRSGLLTEAEAMRAAHKHILTRAVGVQALVEVELGEFPLCDGDLLLLCSDGLTAGVSEDAMLHAVLGSTDLRAVSNRLIALANEAGGSDNTTVIVVHVTYREPGLWNRLYNRLHADPTINPR